MRASVRRPGAQPVCGEARLSDPKEGMPRLIQAGMGVQISCARLANATARLGALGVVSGTGLRHIVIEQVRAGDEVAIKLAGTFPIRRYVEELLSYARGGPRHAEPPPMDHPDPERGAFPRRLAVIAAYVEVLRARAGHRGKVGVNVMWKCALTVLPTIYGAMLGGVDALLCGAGVPMELPDIVCSLETGRRIEYEALTGTGTHVLLEAPGDEGASLPAGYRRPALIPILSNFAFPKRIADIWRRDINGAGPDAFVLENHRAGGHNAPPRDKAAFGERDEIETYADRVIALGIPVYVAGAFLRGGTREDMEHWTARGAHGMQVGSRFALCLESGMREDLKARVIADNAGLETRVLTDNVLSPTGYPFKVVPLSGTLSDSEVYSARKRICNRGYLVSSKWEVLPDGTRRERYICPAMPEAQYVRLGGDPAESADRVCLCNALLATAGFAADGEPALVTLGESGVAADRLWTAREIVEDILGTDYVAARERELALP